MELHHRCSQQAFTREVVEAETCVELSEMCHNFRGSIGKLNRILYGFVQSSCNRNSKLTEELLVDSEKLIRTSHA